MAFTRRGNSIYLDSDGELPGNFVITGVLVTSTSANAVLELHDEEGGTPTSPKAEFRVAATNTTQFWDFSSTPISFQSAIQAHNVANARCTIIGKEGGRG